MIQHSKTKLSALNKVLHFTLLALFALAFISQADEIIVDNASSGFSSLAGNWWSVANGSGFEGSDFMTTGNNGTSRARWDFTLPSAGEYEVYAKWGSGWWGLGSGCPYYIEHDGGVDEVRVDQTQNSGQWVLLGTYAMTPGDGVEIGADLNNNKRPAADAIRVVGPLGGPVCDIEITQQPQEQHFVEGGSVTLTIEASSAEDLTYQWHYMGGDATGANTNTLTLSNLTWQDNSTPVYCVVSNSICSDTSEWAMIVLQECDLTITQQPQNQYFDEGGSASFSIAATSSADISYQWYNSGGPITGATGTSVTLYNLTWEDNSTPVYCVLTDANNCTVESDWAIMIMNSCDIQITQQPQDQYYPEGGSATFTIAVTSAQPLTYQWIYPGGDATGENTNTLTLNNLTWQENSNPVYCIVSNSTCSDTSEWAMLINDNCDLVITEQPQDQYFVEGGSATFSVTATATEGVYYQWYMYDSPVSGATDSTLTLNNLTWEDNGALVYCRMTNPECYKTSETAMLILDACDLQITDQPDSLIKYEGESATFSITATASTPVYYQWYQSGSPIEGATSSTYTIDSLAYLDHNSTLYSCVVSTDICADPIESEWVMLIVYPGSRPITTPNSEKIAISGELYDSNGDPVGYPTPTLHNMSVKLFDAAVDGNALYTETFYETPDEEKGIIVSDGLFTIYLGEGTTADNLIEVIRNNNNIFVEISVDDGQTGPLLPRTPLTASPYSLANSAVVIEGAGDPNTNGTTGNIGHFYINTNDNTTWMKLNASWKMLD